MEKAILIASAAVLVAYVIFTETLDWLGRIDLIRDHFPKFPELLERRLLRLVLVLVAIGLLVRIALESGDRVTEVPSHAVPSLQSSSIEQRQSTTAAQSPTTTPPPKPAFARKQNKQSASPSVRTGGNNSPAIGSVTQGDRSAFSVNQRGGITAGTVILGSEGNLKQRTLILCSGIRQWMNWRKTPGVGPPPDADDKTKWAFIQTESGDFRFSFMEKIRAVRNEYAEMHIKKDDLDEYLRREDQDSATATMIRQAGGHPPEPFPLYRYDFERIIDELTSMTGELKVSNLPPPARRLPTDRGAFIECLKQKPGKFSVLAIEGDQEAYNYAMDWHATFIAAKWKMAHESDGPINPVTGKTWTGIQIGLAGSLFHDPLPKDAPEVQFLQCLSQMPMGVANALVTKAPDDAGGIAILVGSQ